MGGLSSLSLVAVGRGSLSKIGMLISVGVGISIFGVGTNGIGVGSAMGGGDWVA